MVTGGVGVDGLDGQNWSDVDDEYTKDQQQSDVTIQKIRRCSQLEDFHKLEDVHWCTIQRL